MENKLALRTFAADRAAGVTTAPANALEFATSPFNLAASEAADSKRAPVKMMARSGQPIDHWYWGKIVHDMAGFKPSKPTLPIDYRHDTGEVLGVLTDFKAGNDGLAVAGEVISFKEGDRAEEVIFKSRAGVPYEASISFDPDEMLLEQVNEGFTAQVNGYQLEGPALIVRQWVLRGVAICLYGYDRHTHTQLSAGHAGDVPLRFVAQKEPVMEKPAATPAATELAKTEAPKTGDTGAATAADPRAEFKAELAKFTTKFGAANGAAWAAEGLSYEQALEKHAEGLATQLTAEQRKNGDLTTKLSAVDRGEADPVSFSTPEKHAAGQTGKTPAQFAHMGDLGKFAASIKLPGKK